MKLFNSLRNYLRKLFAAPPLPAPIPPMREHRVQCVSYAGLHNIAYTEWGDPGNPRVLLCLHGLTRNGRDFDFLAQSLSDEYRVVCPDIVGRGKSDWLQNKSLYTLTQYATDMVTLIARLNTDSVDVVGTSLGGVVGMSLASMKNSPVRRLVLNDSGPQIAASALRRIAGHLGGSKCFKTVKEAEAFVREVNKPFGNLTDAQWWHLTEHSLRKTETGDYEFAYDPGLARAFLFVNFIPDVPMWLLYDPIQCPTLVIRGAESDLLTRATVDAMQARGPRAEAVEIPGVGHAPMLMDDEQVDIVRNFLLSRRKSAVEAK